jgi:glycosyltransferase involved in cell wall biosynthesis
VNALSVIVPMLNEECTIARTLESIAAAASGAEAGVEVIVVDGGSSDRSRDQARPRCASLVVAPRGLARQMNAGAAAAHGDALVFVHADTLVPQSFANDIAAALADPSVVGGRFDVRLDDDALLLRLVGRLISVRSRLSRTATGDQAIFVPQYRGVRGPGPGAPPEARRPRRLPALLRHHLGAAMARTRCARDDAADVVYPRRVSARRIARAADPPLQAWRAGRK